MQRWRRIPGALALVVALVVVPLAVACDGAGDATPTPSATETPSPEPTAGTLTSLRDADFTAPAIAGALIDRAGGGEIDPSRVRFAQVIDGGPEEAVVIVDSGGTAGEIGAGVYRLTDGRPELIRFLAYNGTLDLNQELIVTREGVYETGDAQCCPSKLHEVTYQWNGSDFAVTTDQVVPNPAR